KRTVFEIDVDDVGPALRYATAKVNRVQRGGGGFGADSGGTAPAEDPWTTGGTTDNFDEPPF
ncbi:MAG: single-stranded DNA-binding protein, partial [Planctomycetes bacterium]|nr:single-stranded DNA-binding protein [Planctomycetota bacterium]